MIENPVLGDYHCGVILRRPFRLTIFTLLSSLQLLWVADVSAAAPQLDYLFPAGARQSAKDVVITAGGTFESWPVKVWTNAPDGWLQFLPDEMKKGELKLSVGAECAAGAYLVRLYSAEGVSAPRIFVIGQLPEELETEPNDNARTATLIESEPVARVINGKLEKSGDIDCFAIDLETGQSMTAEVAAYVLDSPVDPLLHVRGPQGYRLAFNHDAPGYLLDPRLTFTAPATGRYVLELAGFVHPPRADIRFTGSAATRYRLTLAIGAPLATHTWPLAVQRGTASEIAVHLSDGSTIQHEVSVPEDYSQSTFGVPVSDCLGSVSVRVSDVAERVESEAPEKLQVSSAVTALIGEEGEVDRFLFSAEKDVSYEFAVDAAIVGSSLDPVLAIENSDGKELATNDDSQHRFDPELTWKAPADGDYTITVRSRFHRQCGPAFFYRLQCSPAIPKVELTAAADSLTLKPGEKTEFTLNITRKNGHAAALALKVENPPEGILFNPAEIPADAKGEWKLTLESSPDAKAEPSCTPIRIYVHETDKEDVSTLIHHPIKGTNAEAGEMLINQTPDLWLTVP